MVLLRALVNIVVVVVCSSGKLKDDELIRKFEISSAFHFWKRSKKPIEF